MKNLSNKLPYFSKLYNYINFRGAATKEDRNAVILVRLMSRA